MAVAGPVWSDGVLTSGKMLVDGEEVDVTPAAVNMTTLGPVTLVPLVASKRIRVVGFLLYASLNTALEWRSNTTVLIEAHEVAPRDAIGGNFAPGYWTQTAVGEALTMRQEAAAPAVVRGVVLWVPKS